MKHAAACLALALALLALTACGGGTSPGAPPATPPSGPPGPAPEPPPVPKATPSSEAKPPESKPTEYNPPESKPPESKPTESNPPESKPAASAEPPPGSVPVSAPPPPAAGGGSTPKPGAFPVSTSPAPGAKPAAQPARILSYTNPPAEGFRLEVDPASNNTARLLLHLQGPKKVQAYGVAFFLRCGDQAVWTRPGAGPALFLAGRGWNPGENEPSLARAKVLGEQLQVGFFRREGAVAHLGSTPILSLALELRPGAEPGQIRLSVPGDKQAVYLDANRVLQALTLKVGTLVAK